MRHSYALATLALSALMLAPADQVAQAKNDKTQNKTTGQYQATVRRTSFGIPHVQAPDWGSLGFGYGYAFAQDNFCVLAGDVLVATGTRSRYFGPGGGNLASDSVYGLLNTDALTQSAWEQLDADTQDLLTGYAAGYNRYLRDTGVDGLAADCRGASWVRPIDAFDMLKVLKKLTVRAGTANFISSIFAAAPPALPLAKATGASAAPAALAEVTSAEQAMQLLAEVELPDTSSERFGSNAVALGSDLTGGSGALLGNPHFPWFGIERFHALHLTIPGRYDAMGSAIYGFPLVSIGFNSHIAWSHTVSTARRFVVRELTLAPGAPTSYVYDGQVVPMTTQVVSVDVLQPDGSIASVPHTFYLTQFGPVLLVPPLAGWTTLRAYALTDVNLENVRGLRQYREMGSARNLDEFAQAVKTNLALPWVNTIATDSDGGAFYGDISTVPHVTNARLSMCANTFVAQALSSARVYTLDGSTSQCDLGSDADAPQAGIFGAAALPSLVRRDYVQNSNDSYWLANPEARLEGFPVIIGTDEGAPQAFRTRLGITQIRDRLAGGDGLPGTGFGRQWLQDVLFANRHYSAEIMLDGVLTLCAEESHLILSGGQLVDVSEGCDVLAAWDRANKLSSVGTHLWTEFWNRARTAPNLFAVPFSAADPVNTPRNVNLANAALRTRLMNDLAASVKRFSDASIPLQRAWGEVHFDTRGGETIPIHGGSGTSGVYNAIGSGNLIPGVGFTPIVNGSSYIQAVSFTPGGPDARAVVTYSQSTDPESPHFADMTRLFSASGWVELPFKEGAIQQDPNLTVLHLKEKRGL
jgi:acyl-homoserine-lactone acylase